MPAGAPKGNKNAEKWTLVEATKIFQEAIELSNEKEQVVLTKGSETRKVQAYKYDFIGEVARELGYYKSLFTELKKKFPKELKPLHIQLVENLEANCFCNTKKGVIREATGIVNLKSNHKWTDRLDNTSGDEPIKQEPTKIVFKAK